MENLSKFGKEIWIDIIGGILIAISVKVFATAANFAPGGVNGLSLILNYLFGLPIGIISLIINIPIIVVSYKYLGKSFLLRSLKTMAIGALIMDTVGQLFPVYTGNQLMAAIFTGAIGGVGYALIYMQGSSTGGSDFFIWMIKKLFPQYSIGLIIQLSNGLVICLGVIAFKNIDAVLYGVISTVVSSMVIDKIMNGVSSGKVLFIVSNKTKEIAFGINQCVQRGSTF